MRNKYQRKERKSNRKFEVVGGEELMVRVPLPMADDEPGLSEGWLLKSYGETASIAKFQS